MASLLLTEKKCLPCEGNVDPMPKSQAHQYHEQVPQWTLHQKSLEREFRFKDFQEAMKFVNKVAAIAEKEGHHPDIAIFYKRVKLQLTTHAIGGLSENDFIVAAKIDRLE